MKKRMCALLVLTLVTTTTASAAVRLFVTSAFDGYGLDGYPGGHGNGMHGYPIDPFRPTYSEVDIDGNMTWPYDFFYGYYTVTNFPPSNYPSGSCDNPTPILVTGGDFGYVWIQLAGEEKGCHINRLKIEIRDCASGALATVDEVLPTYYYQNDAGNPNQNNCRWNGTCTAPNYPEFHMNPQLLVAVSAVGFVNSVVDHPWNMYKGVSDEYGQTRIALLGALQVFSIGSVYEIKIVDIVYAVGTPTQIVLHSGFFVGYPEPTTLAMASLMALVLRRRWV